MSRLLVIAALASLPFTTEAADASNLPACAVSTSASTGRKYLPLAASLHKSFKWTAIHMLEYGYQMFVQQCQIQ